MDHRSLIRASVLAREPVDDRERTSLRSFVEHFDRLVDPCNEHADDVHVTVETAPPEGVAEERYGRTIESTLLFGEIASERRRDADYVEKVIGNPLRHAAVPARRIRSASDAGQSRRTRSRRRSPRSSCSARARR